jgi:FkbM family methyltransferase
MWDDLLRRLGVGNVVAPHRFWANARVCRLKRAWIIRWQRLTGQQPVVQVAREHATLGSAYGAHHVCLDGLGSSSIVYSVGVGEDASFDVALIERFGMDVHAFDPTEQSLRWVKAQRLPPQFRMNAIALGTHDGVTKFYEPANPAFISHSTLVHDGVSAKAVEVDVRCLRTLMQERGHARLDVLKLDIEGGEYDVLHQLCEQRIECAQILVEFHHHLRQFPYARTKATIERLNAQGYDVFYVSPNGYEVSLIRT